MCRVNRSVLTVLTAIVLCLSTLLAGAASAGSGGSGGGTKGDPQPELTPFRIGAAISAGSAAVEQKGGVRHRRWHLRGRCPGRLRLPQL
jgi:hypothetical protein